MEDNVTISIENKVWIHFEIRDPITICYITALDEELMTFGLSHCKPGDTWDRSKATKLALASAIRREIRNKVLRKLLWDEYFKVFPKKEEQVVHPSKLRAILDLFSMPLGKALRSGKIKKIEFQP